jgi:hypothetical protein
MDSLDFVDALRAGGRLRVRGQLDEAAPTSFLDVRAFYFPKREYDAAIRRFWPRGR